jgi:hypothetical protein
MAKRGRPIVSREILEKSASIPRQHPDSVDAEKTRDSGNIFLPMP